MKNILVLYPLQRDRIHIPPIFKKLGLNPLFLEPHAEVIEKLRCVPEAQDSLPSASELIDEILLSVRNIDISGVMSSNDFPGCILSSIIAQKKGLCAPDPSIVLGLQHKFHSREMQRSFVPEATPEYFLCEENSRYRGNFPCFVKPVRASLSQYTGIICDDLRIEAHIKSHKPAQQLTDLYADFFWYQQLSHANTAAFVLEELLEGHQVCLEGFVVDKKIHILGIVDAHMYPGTMSFERFEYPSQLAKSICMRLDRIARRFIAGTGFNNGFFNIEFIYNKQKDSISIIEVNPRIASQFADLFEKVDGKNTYEMLAEIATGKEPDYPQGQGKFLYAASFVLRLFHDAYVVKTPSLEEVKRIESLFPGTFIELCCSQGKKLSMHRQDPQSFRYGIINTGAQSSNELQEQINTIISLLKFTFDSKE